MRSVKLTLENHVSQQFEGEDLSEDTLVLTLEEAQKWKIKAENENIQNIYTLNEFAGDPTEIPNPYGKSLAAYGECRELLEKMIAAVAEKLNSLAGGEEQWEKYM